MAHFKDRPVLESLSWSADPDPAEELIQKKIMEIPWNGDPTEGLSPGTIPLTLDELYLLMKHLIKQKALITLLLEEKRDYEN